VPDEQDDLLNPAEIAALLNANAPSGLPAGGGQPASSGSLAPGSSASGRPKPGPGAGGGLKDLISNNDIEALLQQRDQGGLGGGSMGLGDAEGLLNQAEADLAAAIAPDLKSGRSSAARLAGAKPFQFEQFDATADGGDNAAMAALQEVELDLRIELGRTELLIEEVLKLREGSVVPLDKLAGDPVDILVNGRLIARGEVLVLNDNFCVRVAEILTPSFP